MVKNFVILGRILEFFVRWIPIEKMRFQVQKLEKYLKSKNDHEKPVGALNQVKKCDFKWKNLKNT